MYVVMQSLSCTAFCKSQVWLQEPRAPVLSLQRQSTSLAYCGAMPKAPTLLCVSPYWIGIVVPFLVAPPRFIGLLIISEGKTYSHWYDRPDHELCFILCSLLLGLASDTATLLRVLLLCTKRCLDVVNMRSLFRCALYCPTIMRWVCCLVRSWLWCFFALLTGGVQFRSSARKFPVP
jgi:hypothetical protein